MYRLVTKQNVTDGQPDKLQYGAKSRSVRSAKNWIWIIEILNNHRRAFLDFISSSFSSRKCQWLWTILNYTK